MIVAFVIWSILSCFFIGLGVYDCLSKKPMPFGLWSNAEVFEVKDVRAYNRAVGKLWCVYGVALALLGVPFLLGGQNSPWVILSILGTMIISIIAMVVYVVVIEKKYRKK